MANRLTDSRKWDDDWFIELSPNNKLLWLYILDKCNHAGIYKHSKRLEECCLGFTPDWEEALKEYNGKVEHLKEGKYFIPRFIQFQYTVLNPYNRCHKSVIDILKNEGVYKGLTSPSKGCIRKSKDKDKDKSIYGKYKHVKLSNEEYGWLLAKFGEKGRYLQIKTIDEGIELKGYKYKNHYLAILKWAEKEKKDNYRLEERKL